MRNAFFQEQEVFSIYQEILRLDPDNIKALRFFKMYYSQSNDWAATERVIETLMRVLPYENDRQRHAMERRIAALSNRCTAAGTRDLKHLVTTAQPEMRTHLISITLEAHQRSGRWRGMPKGSRCLAPNGSHPPRKKVLLFFDVGSCSKARSKIRS